MIVALLFSRPDPLYNELHAGIKNSDDAGVRDTYLQARNILRPPLSSLFFLMSNVQALRGCVSVSGDKLAAAIRRGMTATLLSLLSHAEDSTRSTAAGCLGCMLRWPF